MTGQRIHSRRDDPGVGRRLAYHLSLITLCIAAAAATAVGLYLATSGVVLPALNDLPRTPTQIGVQATLLLVLLAFAPVIVGACAYYLGWQMVRLFQLAGYLRHLRRYVERSLRHDAPLSRLGFTAVGLPFAPDGQPHVGGELPLAKLLRQAPGVLLLGDTGVGKTVALRQHARILSRRRHLVAIAMAQAQLPVLVSLPAYAEAPSESGRPRLRFLAAQIRAFGHRRLASRLLFALPRWHVTLLCDGLEDVPDTQREQIAAELAQLTTAPYTGVRVVIACALDTYLRDPGRCAPLSALARVVAVGPQDAQIARILRHISHVRRASNKMLRDLNARVSALGAQRGHPATLTALLRVRAAGSEVPAGRARLLHAYADVLWHHATGHGFAIGELKLLLGRLASALRLADLSYLPVKAEESAGEAMRRLLLHMEPLMPCARQTAPPVARTADELTRATVAATRASILEWHPDGLGLAFTHGTLASLFAATWLEHADDDDLPLSAELLNPAWHEAVLLWSGLSEQSELLAQRLLALGDAAGGRPRASAPMDASPTHGAMRELSATALALAVALEGLVPPLTSSPGATTDPGYIELVEVSMRDLFEHVQIVFTDMEQRSAFADELMAIERRSGFDLAVHLVTLSRADALGRLVRAQAIAMLGLVASPVALEALIPLLAETDPVLRQAVDAAYAMAGPAGTGALQTALSSPDDRVRSRATETLSQGGAAAISAALAGLDGPDARQRAAAARALGSLNAEGVTEPLLAHLDDADVSVRIAAAWALGQLGSPRALTALEAHLTAKDPEVRASIVQAIGAVRQAGSLPLLVNLLADPAAQVRGAAAEALGKLGDERVLAPLRDLLGDSDPWVQSAAATALRRLGSR